MTALQNISDIPSAVQARAVSLFRGHQQRLYARTDRLFAVLLGVGYRGGPLDFSQGVVWKQQ